MTEPHSITTEAVKAQAAQLMSEVRQKMMVSPNQDQTYRLFMMERIAGLELLVLQLLESWKQFEDRQEDVT